MMMRKVMGTLFSPNNVSCLCFFFASFFYYGQILSASVLSTGSGAVLAIRLSGVILANVSPS